MNKVVVSILCLAVVATGVACSTHRANRNLPPRSDEPAQTKADLAPNDSGKYTGRTERAVEQDNINELDHQGKPVLSPTEPETRPDREITDDVRRAIVADASLSKKAKQVTILTADGVVTLRGSVGSEAERQAVASMAQ